MALLEIKNLHARTENKDILKGVNLTIKPGEVHAIMGPNGSGKSTLSYILAGHEAYEITQGDILLNGNSLLDLSPEQRVAAGVFLAFQYPLEIAGVPTLTFLKTSLNCVRKARGQDELDTVSFAKLVKSTAKALQIDYEMLKRPLNVGFSGGEKKRNDILQMSLLDPCLCILDEIDSGLDIDALRIVSEGINNMRTSARGMLIITHYQRLLDYVVPDIVHIFADGQILKTGTKELALELEKTGYADYVS